MAWCARSPLARAVQEWQDGRLDDIGFVVRTGHRAPMEYELAQPRWSEALPPRPERRSTPSTADNATADPPVDGLSGLTLQRATDLADAMQRLETGREQARDRAARWLALLRRLLLKIGELLGLHADNVMYMKYTELTTPGPVPQGLIALRRSRRAILTDQCYPVVLGLDNSSAALSDNNDTTVTGVPLAPGAASGPVLSPAGPGSGRLPSGCVLVVPTADPAWAVDMASAAAIVMERGNLLCHAAVMARELHVPAVSGIPDARNRFPQGSCLHVDGTTGEVRLRTTTRAGDSPRAAPAE